MSRPFVSSRFQEPATLIQRGPDEIVNRRPVPGAERRTDITVVSAPPDAAKMRQMLPEGTRLTESRTFWIEGVKVEPVGVGANASGGDVIEYGGVSYRAQHVEAWPGFVEVLGIRGEGQ